MPQELTADIQQSRDNPAAGQQDPLLGAAQRTGSRYAEARQRLRDHWAVAKDDISDFRRRAVDYSQSAAKATNTYAHDHPWRTAGAAIGVGALLGWLISRR